MRNALLASLFALAASSGAGMAQQASGGSFVDTFDRFSTTRWEVVNEKTPSTCPARPQNVAVTKSGLTLQVTRTESDTNVLCAGVNSWQRYSFGTFEARLKTGKASGIFTTFFLFDLGDGKRPSAQINTGIMGQDTSKLLTSFYHASSKQDPNLVADMPVDASAEPVDIAIKWGPTQIEWFVNGKKIRTLTSAEAEIPQAPVRIIFNVQYRNQDWLGPLDPAALPLTAAFERIAYTAAGQPCPFPESVACQDSAKRASR